MKTKLLSLLMLISCTAVFVGFSNGNKCLAQTPPERCRVCDTNDTYEIPYAKAMSMIIAFHNKILKNSIISNAGGFFTLNKVKSTTNDFLSNYPSFKLHWALEKTKEAPLEYRLFITTEPTSINCLNNTYEGSSGIEGIKLNASVAENDIAPFTTKDIDLDLKTLETIIKGNLVKDRALVRTVLDADVLMANFYKHKDLYGLYQCEDIVFNKKYTWEVLTAASNHQSFYYFFGYDEEQTYHRLRLIIASYEIIGNEYKIKFTDAGGKTLLRETSRPRP